MIEFDQAEFWQALNRLYDTAVALKDTTEAQARTAEAHEERFAFIAANKEN